MTEWILLYATFLAAAWVLKEDGHVKIDVVLIRLSPKKQYILSVIVCILGILTCGFFSYHGAKAIYSLYQRDVIMMGMILMPKYILVAVIPLGILLSCIQFIRILKGLLAGKISKSDADWIGEYGPLQKMRPGHLITRKRLCTSFQMICHWDSPMKFSFHWNYNQVE